MEKARIAQQKAIEAEASLRETRLTEEIEARRKHRNDVEKDTAIRIWEKNLEAEEENLRIGRETEYLRLEQQRDIAVRRAEREAEIAKRAGRAPARGGGGRHPGARKRSKKRASTGRKPWTLNGSRTPRKPSASKSSAAAYSR